ncbi:MAG: 16S rRNA (adenine(1518)-N(6)/adenine(1519)-N(6))-dimethyltransferase RsmA [Ignavibacteriota bacterium]
MPRPACPTPAELVIEIGPGRGALTEKLLQRAARVIAIELDAYLVEHLRQKFAAEPRLEVIHADVLATDLMQWGSAPVAGNLPYYITSPILELAMRSNVPRAVFLMQKEVAERLAAHPGSRDYGYLTVQTALYATVRSLFDVKPGAFHPPPKVDSAVVLLEPHHRDWGVDRAGLLRFVGHSFEHKRKTLRNNLAGFYGKEMVDAWPEAGMRAEQLSVEDFVPDVCENSGFRRRYRVTTELNLDYAEARKAIEAILAELTARGKAAVIAVADSRGELIALVRMDGAPVSSIPVAGNKAFTAAPSAQGDRRCRCEGPSSRAGLRHFLLRRCALLRLGRRGAGAEGRQDRRGRWRSAVFRRRKIWKWSSWA